MLNNEEIARIKEKMKKTKTYSATFARRLNMTRQCINVVLNGKATSKNVENYLREWMNEE